MYGDWGNAVVVPTWVDADLLGIGVVTGGFFAPNRGVLLVRGALILMRCDAECLREQARSHKVSANDTNSLWERACSRMARRGLTVKQQNQQHHIPQQRHQRHGPPDLQRLPLE